MDVLAYKVTNHCVSLSFWNALAFVYASAGRIMSRRAEMHTVVRAAHASLSCVRQLNVNISIYGLEVRPLLFSPNFFVSICAF